MKLPFLKKIKKKPSVKYPRQVFEKPPAKKSPQWSINLLKELDWKNFEDLSANYFKTKGWKANVTQLGADEGIDIILYESNKPDKILGIAQCKAWTKKPVGVSYIRELFGIMHDKGCQLGIFITIAGYTDDAYKFAHGKHIQLLDATKLLALIEKLPEKSQTYLLNEAIKGDYKTPSCPQCGIKLIKRTSKKKRQHFWGCMNFPKCRHTMYMKSKN